MKITKLCLVLFLVAFNSIKAQNIPNEYKTYLANINKILKQYKLPLANDFSEFRATFKDDFEYIRALYNLNKPYQPTTKEFKFYDFTINKAELVGNKCYTGSCNNGEGILTIAKGKIYYIGNFMNNFPHKKGFLYFVDKGILSGTFYKGRLSEATFLGTKNQLASVETFTGMLGKVKNWYTVKFDAIYNGHINKNFEFAESNYDNTLKSNFINVKLRQEVGSNKITSFFGTIKDKNGTNVEGSFDVNYKLIDGSKVKITKKDGTVISGKALNGKLDRFYNVIVKEGNTTYNGEVDENYKPHGRGFAIVDGKRLPNERWNHGKPLNTGLPKKSNASSYRNTNKISPRDAYVGRLQKECTLNWSKYKYCGIAKGNVTIAANGKRQILFINLSNTRQEIKIKPLFVMSNSRLGRKSSWITVSIPPSSSYTGKNIGLKKMEMHFPLGVNGKHNIAVKGRGMNSVYWVVQ